LRSTSIEIRAVPPTDDDLDAAAEAMMRGTQVVLDFDDYKDEDGMIVMRFKLLPEPC
jgi:hypothetical protein